MSDCICSSPGFCQRFQKEMQQGQFEICSEKFTTRSPLPTEKCAVYRRRWEGEAITQPERPAPPTPEEIKKHTKLALARAWMEEMIKWRRAGKPIRTPEQIEQCLAACRTCDRFDGKKCTECGCPAKGIFNIIGLRAKARIGSKCPHPNGSRWPLELI